MCFVVCTQEIRPCRIRYSTYTQVMVLPEKTGGENRDHLVAFIMRRPSIALYYFILQLLFTFGRDDILKGPWAFGS